MDSASDNGVGHIYGSMDLEVLPTKKLSMVI
jgi:hypothetical protein